MSIHPLHDQMKAARVMARMVARGLLTVEECSVALVAAAQHARPDYDKSGASAEINWTLRDTVNHERAAIARVQRDLDYELEPMIRSRSGSRQILETAVRLNERRGDPVLSDDELFDYVQSMVTRLDSRGARYGKR